MSEVKLASCQHHWLVVGNPIFAKDTLHGYVACILCFKYAPTKFEPIGYAMDAATAKVQRARRRKS